MDVMNLQAIWHEGALYLWGRRSHGPVTLAAVELRALLGELCTDSLLGSIGAEAALDLWLPDESPAAGGVPEAVGPGGGTAWPGGEPGWRLVHVEALRFSPADAADLLAGLGRPLPGACGASVGYWAQLTDFLLERIARQQFFPDVQAAGGGITALWRLLVGSGVEVQALEKYAGAMPGVCRAVRNGPAREPAAIMESFLIATTDALIRREVASDPFYEGFARRSDLPATPEVAWLRALVGPEARVGGPPEQLGPFVERLKEWLAPVDQGRSSLPIQLRFVLLEPEDEEEREEEIGTAEGIQKAELAEEAEEGQGGEGNKPAAWRLKFQILPLQRDAAVLDAAELWAKDTLAAGVLSRNIFRWREQLLAELRRAAEACPLLERALAGSEPEELALSTLEAHTMIYQWAPALRQMSFAVDLPAWASQREREVGLLLALDPGDGEEPQGPHGAQAGRAGAAADSGGRFGLHTLLDFDWQIAVGDMRLSVEEFRNLAQERLPLVKFRGSWLHIDPDLAERALAFLERRERKRMTLAEAFRTAYAGGTESGLPILGLRGSRWVGDLLAQAPGQKLQEVRQPEGFIGTLRPYQIRGLAWLAFLDSLGIGACLADDMGLGKTIQLIALLLQERQEAAGPAADGRPPEEAGAAVGPTLLFAPTSVVGNWVREVQRFSPNLRVLVHHGPERLRGEAFLAAARAHDVVITSYALAYRDFADLRRPAWHRVALDEAQKIKNPSAAGTLAIRGIAAPHRVALTGTPIENHLSELWSIMEALNPGLLGSAGQFRERFAVPIEKFASQERAAQLREMIKPFVLRRAKTDPQIAGDLPEKMEARVYCNLTPEQAALYQATTAEMLGQIDTAAGIRRRGLILSALTRLKQICDHPALVGQGDDVLEGRSGKAERLAEMLEEVLEEGDAALVFTQYRTMGHLLERWLPERLRHPVLFLHGGTPAKQRNELVRDFQEGKGSRIFLLSLRAGGLGLNLTAANHVFHFDRWWNPAVESQATDRAHRIGQTRKVQVHKFVCVGTVEERIDRLLADKLAVASKIVTTGDQWLTSLSTDELRAYLALGDEAVGEF